MKNINFFTIILISITTLVYGGGEFSIITPYETEDAELATDAEVPIVQEPITVTPKVIPPPPIVRKIEEKDINPSGFYAGLGISNVKYNPTCNCKIGSKTDNNVAMVGRVGYDFNRYIGIEARGMKTVAKDNESKISHAGLFIKPMIPLLGNSNLYALVGVAKTSATGKLQNSSAEGLSLGAGLEVDLSKDSAKEGKYSRDFDGEGDQEKGIGLFIDYERLIIKDNAPKIDTISAGVTYDF
jgi:OOP family OmpA-OmpF porin